MVDFRRISFLIYKGLMVEDERFFSQSEKKRASWTKNDNDL